MSDFNGKRILITGGASGIGAAAARKFAAAGATLFLADVNADGLAAVKAELGDCAMTRQVDLSEQSEVEAMVDAAVEAMGGLEILLNNAGIGGLAAAADLDPAEWRKILAVDLDAVFYATRKALPHLIETRGVIVNTASLSGLGADFRFTAYNSAKAGVIGLTRNVAIDYATQGVRVNALCPGFTDTQLTSATPAPVREAMIAEIPMGRAGTAEEMADAIVFLAGPGASFITGQCLVVDGGIAARTGQPDMVKVMMGG